MKLPVLATAVAALELVAATSEQGKIVGGVEATEGRYPYFTSLLADLCLLSTDVTATIKSAESDFARLTLQKMYEAKAASKQDCSEPDFFRFCGASMVTEQSALSAGHCFIDLGDIQFPTAIRIGDFNDESVGVNEFFVAESIVHPKFNDNSLRNDFMVVNLAEAVPDAALVRPRFKKLDTAEATMNEKELTVIGFGALESGGYETPDTLREVDVALVSDEVCGAAYGNGYKSGKMVCAGSPGKDSCQGDSGGPIFQAGDAADGSEDRQVGIVSFGIGCADPDFPGVYSRIRGARSFIRKNIIGETKN